MKSAHALPRVFWFSLIVLGVLSACDEADETDGSGAADTSGGGERDVRSPGAADTTDTSTEDTGATDVSSGGYSARYEELIEQNFAACVEFCESWEGCGEEVLVAGETCDDFCAVDADILRANIPDQADGYDCMQAGVDAYACNAGLSCDEVTEYNTDEATTLCATEDANFGTFCRAFF